MNASRNTRLAPFWLIFGVVGVVLGAAGCALFRPSVPQAGPVIREAVPPSPLVLPETAAEFVGTAKCVSCHPNEGVGHRDSVHSHTVYAANAPEAVKHFRTTQKLFDRALEATYSFEVEGDQPAMVVRKKGGVVEKLTPAYLIGSGKYGMTPVYERDGIFMEGRVSYYPEDGKWGWTPGQLTETFSRQAEGRTLGPDEAMNCFLCHGTVVVQDGPKSLAAGTRLDVGCERCHGPGRQHVQAAEAGQGGRAIYTYSGASANTVLTLCAQCHRRPNNATTVDLERDPNLPRFAGTALGASKCFTRSGGKLTCVTCHNPHQPVSQDTASYERICRSCHESSSKEQKACPVNPRAGCIPCHMPRQGIEMPGDAQFHNHLIKATYRKLSAAALPE
jgi:hypothetical protein